MKWSISLAVVVLALVSWSKSSGQGATHLILMPGEDFSPFDLTIAVGDTVTWSNEGLGGHNVRAVAGEFSSSTLSNGASFSYSFRVAGVYRYLCGIHPSTMTGVVRVVDGVSTVAVPVPTVATAVSAPVPTLAAAQPTSDPTPTAAATEAAVRTPTAIATATNTALGANAPVLRSQSATTAASAEPGVSSASPEPGVSTKGPADDSQRVSRGTSPLITVGILVAVAIGLLAFLTWQHKRRETKVD